MVKQDTLVLASVSPRRKRMFEELGLPIEIIPSDVVERRDKDESPEDFARRAAWDKARAVAERLWNAGRRPWLVGADTIVVLGDDVLMKPKDAFEAKAMLRKLSGRTHTVVTGWVAGRYGGPWMMEHAQTAVTFHDLSEAQIAAYVATDEGMDKAGAYAIQGIGVFLVDRINGDYFNVVGLPISRVVRALVEIGALPAFPLP
ncbi:MAG: Maf family protein [Myxococcota bacterium]|nr:Maf family protein [Myxococcota bacterium]